MNILHVNWFVGGGGGCISILLTDQTQRSFHKNLHMPLEGHIVLNFLTTCIKEGIIGGYYVKEV
jgi:hypothetical protein